MGLFDGLTSSVSDLFGGAPNNAGFQAHLPSVVAPAGALIQTGTNPDGTPVWGANPQAGINATNAVTNALGLQTALSSYNAPQNQQNVFNQEQSLASKLQEIANGTGPSPAHALLNNQTGNNIATQAALAAGQRGSGANVGLIARQVGQQGANIEQQAAGQGAALTAQEQLASIGALQNQQGQLANLASTQTGQLIQNAGVGANAANQNLGLNNEALANFNSSNVAANSNANSTNAALAEQNSKNTSAAIGGLAQGAAAALPLAGIPLAQGGEISDATSLLAQVLSKKRLPDHLKAVAQIYHPKVLKMAQGAEVPGKPQFPGKNTTSQDSVPALLTPKEIVLPLSVTQSKNPGEAAKQFVEKIKGKDQFKEALRDHIKNRKSKAK